jgi:hypothetical protein
MNMEFFSELEQYQPYVFIWGFIGLIVCLTFVGRMMDKRHPVWAYALGIPFATVLWPLALLAIGWTYLNSKMDNGQF